MKSIRRALLVRLVVGGMLLLGAAAVALDLLISRALKQEFDRGLLLSAEALRAFVEQKNGVVRMDSDVDDILEFGSSQASSFFLLKTADGRELKRSRSLGDGTLPLPADLPASRQPLSFPADLGNGRHLRCIALRFQPVVEEPKVAPESVEEVVLIVAREDQFLHRSQTRIRDALAITGGAALCALAALLAWGVRRGLLPLERLSREISAVDAKSLDSRFATAGLPSELQPVAAHLNHLLERLETAFQREKRFTSAVAHELRTPLAELLALAEVNLLAPVETPQGRAESWQETVAIVRRMESLALRLLELARAEQHQWQPDLREVKVLPLLQSIWARAKPLALSRGIGLDVDFPAELFLRTDPILFELIVTNLVGNAVRYAAPDSILRVSGDGTSLSFSNRTTDLTAEDADLLFERFWKKDSSRHDSSRHGLGLSLVLEIAKLLGIDLRAKMNAPDRIDLVLVFEKEVHEQPLGVEAYN